LPDARAARRIVTLRDGQIQSDVPIQTEFERDLIDLKHSALGQAILQNNGLSAELRALARGLREVLERVQTNDIAPTRLSRRVDGCPLKFCKLRLANGVR
jgi:hypothetical protein